MFSMPKHCRFLCPSGTITRFPKKTLLLVLELGNRAVVDIDNKDPIFHVIYDLDDRFQVPGWQFHFSGLTYEWDGFEAKGRGIYDDKGRLMVAICHNMDLGDAWEGSGEPRTREKVASLAYRIARKAGSEEAPHW